ncbi:hypothetical protein [Kitasatospora aureofaciens]|uniref:hypothetical protein n=1 Tax=Kitasatospora aureofaciens TaxID=1894 RepID=UPI001C4382F4|nr:hypothetical protein [Kitasatospora aureofaciens]MBV6701705.1 hypothetical protein [Kitasatospora aureofaciens]
MNHVTTAVDKLALRMDGRRRRIDGASATVAELGAGEALLEVPARPFPAEPEVERTVSPQGLAERGVAGPDGPQPAGNSEEWWLMMSQVPPRSS